MHGFAGLKNPLIKDICISWFIKKYQVDLSDAVLENPKNYRSFNDFFTRKLKQNARPIANSSIISPVDGTISQLGTIKKGQIIQAKNHAFSVQNLLANTAKSHQFEGGQFATIYLSPKDYHRIHAPFDGVLKSMSYIPGTLFSVNQKSTLNTADLFAKNERVICYFKTDFGEAAVILVGAILVGSIQTTWQGKITPPYQKTPKHFTYQAQKISLKKGEELGNFNMGSTVILLLPPPQKLTKQTNDKIKMGEVL